MAICLYLEVQHPRTMILQKDSTFLLLVITRKLTMTSLNEIWGIVSCSKRSAFEDKFSEHKSGSRGCFSSLAGGTSSQWRSTVSERAHLLQILWSTLQLYPRKVPVSFEALNNRTAPWGSSHLGECPRLDEVQWEGQKIRLNRNTRCVTSRYELGITLLIMKAPWL